MWGRIDDKLHAHPKWVAIRDTSPAWLFWSCLSWALAYSPSGFVPTHVAKGFGPSKTMEKLVEAGLWERVDAGFLIHDFAAYATKQTVDPELAAVRAEAGRLGGQARAAVRITFPNVTETEKSRARGQVFRAVRAGKLTKGPCIVCGSSESRAHHRDYSKPLEVTWLCSRHHEHAHRADEPNVQATAPANEEANDAANGVTSPRAPTRASPDPDPDPDVYDVGLPSAPTADRAPLVPPLPPVNPDAPKPLLEAWRLLEARGFARDLVTTCLNNWHGSRDRLPVAVAYVLAHSPKDAGAGLIVTGCRTADPDLVEDWDRAGRPAPTAPPPKAPEKAQVRFDLGLDEPPPPPRKPRQPPPPPLRRVGDAPDGSQGVQTPTDAPAAIRAIGGAT